MLSEVVGMEAVNGRQFAVRGTPIFVVYVLLG